MKRKVARIGNSLMVAIPSQFAQHDNIQAGDFMEIEHIGIGEFSIKKSIEKRGKKKKGL